MSWKSGMRNLTSIVALVAIVFVAGYIGYQKSLPSTTASNDEPKVVDFSVSLECRALEGPLKKPLMTTVEEYEEESAKAERYAAEHNGEYPPWGPQDVLYDKRVPVAYVQGKLEDGSWRWLSGTVVSEVTNDAILLNGWFTPIGPMHIGSLNRRTGEGGFTVYRPNTPKSGTWEGATRGNIVRQFALQCEPAEPAKF